MAGRGFAGLSKERQKEIASMGGRAVKPENRSFSKDRGLAATAGKLGGLSVDPRKRTFSLDHEKARVAGAKGGKMVPAGKRSFSDVEKARAAGKKSHKGGVE
jgi:general stress protein YciG